ncbi:Saccharopine dehydrogenase [Fusarium oxysporum f. sp. albedinis]|nr:Saccharopine dehydrogenase [Fusarium oxysporum f. sp. albedinis]
MALSLKEIFDTVGSAELTYKLSELLNHAEVYTILTTLTTRQGAISFSSWPNSTLDINALIQGQITEGLVIVTGLAYSAFRGNGPPSELRSMINIRTAT